MSLCQPTDDSQDDQAEDVVDNGGSQHDLAFWFLKSPQVCQHTGRDSHAGGRERAPSDNRHKVVESEEATNGVTPSERQHHADNGYGRGSSSHLDELAEVRLQTDLKEENDDAQLCEEMENLVVRADQTENGYTKEYACYQFPEDGRLADAFRKSTSQLG